MSFSRWTNSRWYTFWSSNHFNSLSERRKDQIFEICANTTFTYQEIKEDIENCLNIACENEKKVYENSSGLYEGFDDKYRIDESLAPTPAEREELKGYMIAFMIRVESDTDLID